MNIKKNLTGLAHVGIMVSDIEKSRDFYCGKLGFEFLFEKEIKKGSVKVAFCQLGDFVLEFVEIPGWAAEREDGIVDHIAICVESIEESEKMLENRGIAKESDVEFKEDLFGNGIKTLVFRGPDSERLEFLQLL